MTHKNKDALEALNIIETDFCMGVARRAINDEGISILLETIREALTQASENEAAVRDLAHVIDLLCIGHPDGAKCLLDARKTHAETIKRVGGA